LTHLLKNLNNVTSYTSLDTSILNSYHEMERILIHSKLGCPHPHSLEHYIRGFG
jgi:hypothetical protein